MTFTCPGTHAGEGVDVSSAGPDRRLGTDDDLNSPGSELLVWPSRPSALGLHGRLVFVKGQNHGR